MMRPHTHSKRPEPVRKPRWLRDNLTRAVKASRRLDHGERGPELITNITPTGQFLGDSVEVLDRLQELLLKSGRLFRQGSDILFLAKSQQGEAQKAPFRLAADGVLTKNAAGMLANVVMCRLKKGKADAELETDGEVQFQVPSSVLQQAVSRDGFMAKIPEARYVVSHPVYDADFQWLGPGYHAAQKILVCGEAFEPMPWRPARAQDKTPGTVDEVLCVLPVMIRTMVEGFHWSSPVDLVNFIGAALMIPLMPMLVDDGHPGVMFWGNQPGIGKSVAAQCLAILKDGEQASPTALDSGSREVENQIVSELNDGRTVLFIDNQKGSLDIPILEANMTASQIGVRIFHDHGKARRPNDILWLLTTNNAMPSDDLLSRCVHVRLHYEGDPGEHRFTLSERELVEHVRTNRNEILAELAGLVDAWLDAGRPENRTPSRFALFGRVIGSILALNGLPGLLSNAGEEVRGNSTTHQQLLEVAERLLDSRPAGFLWECVGAFENADEVFKEGVKPASPMQQKDWVPYLLSAGVIPASCDTAQKQKKAATQYLSAVVKKPIEVEVGGRVVRAMIVSRSLGKRRTSYALAVEGALEAPSASMGSTHPADSESPQSANTGLLEGTCEPAAGSPGEPAELITTDAHEDAPWWDDDSGSPG